jgi:hypothetical protein
MIHPASQQTLLLTPHTTDISINTVSPFLLTINPQFGLSLENIYAEAKPFQIEYNFNDGSPVLIQKLFASPSVSDTSLPWPEEPGDPRNYPVEHLFSLKNSISANYTASIIFSWIANPDEAVNYVKYNISINLYPPSLASGKYFKDIHLVSTRMFGPKDIVMYNFEGVEPSFGLPVLVDWIKPTKQPALPSIFKSGIASSEEIEKSLEYRPVKILPPFYQKVL